MIGVLGHDSVLQGYTGPGTTWLNDICMVKHNYMYTYYSTILALHLLLHNVKGEIDGEQHKNERKE